MRQVAAVSLLVLAACAPEGTDPLDPTSLDPDAPTTVSGSLEGADGHSIMIVDGPTGAAWLVPLKTSGAFASPELPAGTYAITALDAAQRPVGIYQQDGETMLSLSGAVDLGALALDAARYSLSAADTVPSSRRSGKTDFSDLGGIQTAKNASGGNGLDVTRMESSDGDIDGDGVPDLLDNDSNENGVYDTAEGRTVCVPRLESYVGDTDVVPESAWAALRQAECAFFDNLKLSVTTGLGGGDGDLEPHSSAHVLAAHFAAPDALRPYIDRVEVVSMPPYADASVAMAAGGWAFTDYPTPGAPWSDTSHAMPLATGPMGEQVHSIWIDTDGDPHPALYQLRVTLLDGSTIRYTTRVFFSFATPPQLSALSDGSGDTLFRYPMSEGETGTSSAPAVLDGSGAYTLYASRPLDGAGGSEICGMDVSAEIFYEDSAGRQLNTTVVNTPRLSDTGACDPSVALSVDLDGSDLPDVYDGSPVARYRIAVMVSGPAGDNAASNLWATY